ncbi:MAG: hypothetical protein WAS25_08760 [Geothrix sp.]|uniref:hypothetical protein n=1 Tax=Geothrix sp. TaxID=1962974 RepID=UPI003BB0F951
MDKLKWVCISGAAIGLLLLLVCLMRMGVKPESRKWYGILYASDYFPPLNGFPDAKDADERTLICRRLEKKYQFEMSTLHPDHKAFYGLPGSKYTLITVYGISNPIEQQRLVDVARGVRQDVNARSFVIEFYAKETGPSPRDQFLRKVRID